MNQIVDPSPTSPPLPPPGGPPGFHLLAKPSGATCNIDCSYCFYLSKQALYPNQTSRMSEATHEAYIRQLLESHRSPQVTVAWQGGEPTLMKLEFFKHSIELVQKFRRPGQEVLHTFQTNGLLIDDDWCRFFKQHDFLVGLSVDGPRELHDAYRLDRRGKGTFTLVMRAWECLRRYDVDFNILCTVNAANQAHGRDVYRFLRDELGAKWIQFIPIVERTGGETLSTAQSRGLVTERSVGGAQYGNFLIDVFEEWLRRDVGQVFVQLFDVTLEAFFGRHLLCSHAPTCGYGPVLEYNGDLYACDHFVEPGFRLGNIHDTHMLALLDSPAQRRFGRAKRDTLTGQCKSCEVRNWCNGGCPKDRFVLSRDGEPGHNYLCAGLYKFFLHAGPMFGVMADLLRRDRAPADIMAAIAELDAQCGPRWPCACGSGKEFGACHGH